MILLYHSVVTGQGLDVEIRTGYGFYNLKDIKHLQRDLLAAVKIPGIRSVEVFPDNMYYGLSLNRNFEGSIKAGIEMTFFSTGGRNHLADYSGEYKMDMLLRGYQIGPRFEKSEFKWRRFMAGLQLSGGISLTELKLDERLTVFNTEASSEKIKLTSTGWFVEPSLRTSYKIYTGLFLSLCGGYHFNHNRPLKSPDGETRFINDWSGIRASLGISYTFSNIPKK